MRNVRIIHIFAGDLKAISEGGIATYIRELIKDEIIRGGDVSLVGVTGDPQDKIGVWQERKLASGSFKFLPLFYTSGKHLTYKKGVPLNAKFLVHLWANRKRILSGKCLVHVHRSELALPFLYPRAKVPVILTIHGLGKAIEQATTHILYNKTWFRRFYYLMESFVIRKANAVILVSREGLDHYTKRFSRLKDKFILIPTLVDTGLFKLMDKKAMRSKYNFIPDNKILLFVGRFDHLKGLDLLLDGFELISRNNGLARLLLVGEGIEKRDLQIKVSEKKIPGVEFMGMIEHHKIAEIMNCADAFVLTSLWEGLPLVALEALACGLPVVSTPVGQMGEIVRENRNGFLISKRDREEVRDKVMLALERSESMRAQCLKAAEGYSSSAVSGRIGKVYQEVYQKKYG